MRVGVVQVCVMGCSLRASTKTLRGILAFDLAAQAVCRNHRGRALQFAGTSTLALSMPGPNKVILQCLFAKPRCSRMSAFGCEQTMCQRRGDVRFLILSIPPCALAAQHWHYTRRILGKDTNWVEIVDIK